jgi:hypothetical protein
VKLTEEQLERLKELARLQNANKNWKGLRNTLALIDQSWKDDHAAMSFFTELE